MDSNNSFGNQIVFIIAIYPSNFKLYDLIRQRGFQKQMFLFDTFRNSKKPDFLI